MNNLIDVYEQAKIDLIKAKILANGLEEKVCTEISDIVYKKYSDIKIIRDGQSYTLHKVTCFLKILLSESRSADMTLFLNYIIDKDIAELNDDEAIHYTFATNMLHYTKKWPEDNKYNMWRSELYYCSFEDIINNTVKFDIDNYTADEDFVIK